MPFGAIFVYFSENGCRTRCFGTAFWGSWEALGAFWGTLRDLLGPLGAFLGGSWGLLGVSWPLLGTTWRRPKHHQDNMRNKINFQTPPRRIIHVFGPPFWDPKSTKIASKTRQKLRRCSRAKKLLSKNLLGPSWADLEHFGGRLGEQKTPGTVCFKRFCENSQF